MDPVKMINRLDELAEIAARLASDVRTRTFAVSGKWDRIGDFGGQRADHAAKLMTEMIEPLRAMQDFADIAIMQIKEMSANPFETETRSTWRD